MKEILMCNLAHFTKLCSRYIIDKCAILIVCLKLIELSGSLLDTGCNLDLFPDMKILYDAYCLLWHLV